MNNFIYNQPNTGKATVIRKLYLLIIMLFLIFPVFSETFQTGITSKLQNEEEQFSFTSALSSYGLGLAETQISNISLWGFNRFITREDYAMISWETMRSNMTSSWVWDQDEFIVNHLGHPYQGSVYYSAARTAGNNFWASSSITILGSISWELFMETETPSINDLIVTTFGGISVGEMFYRLNEVILNSADPPGPFHYAGATLLSPATTINRKLLSGKSSQTGELNGFSFAGVGFSMADISVLPRPSEYHWNFFGASNNYNLDLQYNTPFIKSVYSSPYDWFRLKINAGLDLNSEFLLACYSTGHLYGWTFYNDDMSVRNQLGFYLNYDLIYNRVLNMGANTIGGGWIRTAPLGKNWKMDSQLFINYVPIGASDLIFLKYNDIVNEPPDYERRNYSLGSGSNLKLDLVFARKDRLYIDLYNSFYNLYIIDSSVPESGSGGIELIGISTCSMKYFFTKKWFAGFQSSLYHKESFYMDYDLTLQEIMFKFELISGFRF